MSIFFPLRADPFFEGTWYARMQTDSHNRRLLCKNRGQSTRFIQPFKVKFILYCLGEDHEIDVGYKSSDMAATLQGNIQQDEDNFVLHLEAKLCDHLQSSCHQPMEVLSGIRFPSTKPNGKDIVISMDKKVET